MQLNDTMIAVSTLVPAVALLAEIIVRKAADVFADGYLPGFGLLSMSRKFEGLLLCTLGLMLTGVMVSTVAYLLGRPSLIAGMLAGALGGWLAVILVRSPPSTPDHKLRSAALLGSVLLYATYGLALAHGLTITATELAI